MAAHDPEAEARAAQFADRAAQFEEQATRPPNGVRTATPPSCVSRPRSGVSGPKRRVAPSPIAESPHKRVRATGTSSGGLTRYFAA